MKAIFFKFQRSFWGFWVCFTEAAFDTDTFQHAILNRNDRRPNYPLSGDMIILCVGK